MTTRSRLAATLLSTLAAGGALVAWSADADAQAWVGDKGQLNADVRYTFGASDEVIDFDGGDIEPGDGAYPITNHTTTVGVDYVAIENLALRVELPLMGTKYDAQDDARPDEMFFPAHGDYDDGDLHFTLTDLRLGARYQALSGSNWAISPNVGFSIPVADYETQGYAAAGRGVLKGHVGAAAGFIFDPWVPNLYTQVSYEFTKGGESDSFDGAEIFNQDYSDLVAGLGYIITPELIVQGSVINHWSHGGVAFNELGGDFGLLDQNPNIVQDVIFGGHDAVLDEDYMVAGLDLAYQVTDAIGLSASAHFFVDGENSRNVNAFAFGMSYQILAPKYEPIEDDWDDEDFGDFGDEEFEGDEGEDTEPLDEGEPDPAADDEPATDEPVSEEPAADEATDAPE